MNIERAFACAVMHDENILFKSPIDPNDLQDIIARKIILAAKDISFSGNKVDLGAVCFYLKSEIPASEISEVYDLGALHTNWSFYSESLSKLIMGRKIEGLFPFVRDLINGGNSPTDIIAKSSEYLDNISIGFKQYKIQSFADVIPELVEETQAKIENKGELLNGIPTGLPILDDLTGGFKAKELWYIGARPSDGKSASLNGFVRAALDSGNNPGVITVESSLKEIVRRTISSDSMVPLGKIKSGAMTQSQIASYTESAMKFYDKPPYGYDEPNADLMTVMTQARRLVSVFGCNCLYIDYAQLITPNNRSVPRHEQVADISKALKSLTRELEVPIVAAAQLNRPQKGRENSRPHTSDLKESGQLEQDADGIILIWHKKSEESDQAESLYLLEKQRDGETKDIPVFFNKPCVMFEQSGDVPF